jgi:hypothetical protein
MRTVLLIGVVAACHGNGPASTGSASGSGSACATKLDEVARFYNAVADDNASATPPDGLHRGAIEAGVETLAEAAGAPADLTKANVLFVGTRSTVLVEPSGEIRRGASIPYLGAQDPTRTLAIEIDQRVPWQRVEEVREALGGAGYAATGVAYRTKGGAFAGRTIPRVAGAEPGRVDIPTIVDGLAKTAAEHCPDYAKQSATLQSRGLAGDPELLHALARTIPHCDCGIDTAQLEVLPWLVARPLVTVVPFAASAPQLHGPGMTWGDLVRDAEGPVAMALPAIPPPPPPPPPHRR